MEPPPYRSHNAKMTRFWRRPNTRISVVTLFICLISNCWAFIDPNDQLHVTHKWSHMNFDFSNIYGKIIAQWTGVYKPYNILPYGIEIWKDRLFITLPKFKDGVPATVASVKRNPRGSSPQLQPFPNWKFYSTPGCGAMTSVFSVRADSCGRLWALDSGKINLSSNMTKLCPPKLFIFDLNTNALIRRHVIPEDQKMIGNLFTNMVVDYRCDCEDTFAYMADSVRYNLVVYSYKNNKSWKISHGSFYPDPLKFSYELNHLSWYWNYGISGMTLGPVDSNGERKLYYHAMSSYSEFSVPTSVLREPGLADKERDKFVLLGPRGYVHSQASGEAMDNNGIIFYGLIEHNIVACWDSATSYNNMQQGIVGLEKKLISYPNDVKVDQEKNQSVWVLSNNLHRFLYGEMDFGMNNFVILSGQTEFAVKKTVCSSAFNQNKKFASKTNANMSCLETSSNTPSAAINTSSTTTTEKTSSTTRTTSTTTATSSTTTTSTTTSTTTEVIPTTASTTTAIPKTAPNAATPIETTTAPTTTISIEKTTSTPTTTIRTEKTTSAVPITTTTASTTTATTTTTTTVKPPAAVVTTRPAASTNAPAHAQSGGGGGTLENQLLQAGQNALENCKDSAIIPNPLKPCRILNKTRNLFRKIIFG